MSFKPKNSGGNGAFAKRDPNAKFPVPKAGNRPARVSLVVDLGNQNRKDFEDPITKELKPQKPADQIAIFLDLTADVVDYGSVLGKQPYRLMLNKSFMGEVDGINFTTGPVRDAQGAVIQGRPYNYHPMSVITKLAKAAKVDAIIDGVDLDIGQLLNKPLLATVEVKRTEDKNGKKDEATGKVRVYENVNFRGVSEVPEIEDGVFMKIPECQIEPRIISFDNASIDDIKYIRRDVLAKIKTANNYNGSKMQKAIEDFEAASANANPEPAPKAAEACFDYDEDLPF